MSDMVTPPPVPQHKTSALAVWSLVLGILSLMCFSIFTAIPGVICGHKAIWGIEKSGGSLSGKGLAIGGLVTGYIGIAMGVFIIPMMMAIAIPNFVKAREISMRNACSNNMHEIQAAKNEWALAKNKSQGDVPTVDDLTPYLPDHKFPTCPAGGTYTIGAVSNDPTCSFPGHVMIQ
ncbi:MAG TPA: DUF4190 domain-containing protein [Candidatus Sulfotelmatobacter sp.]|nr:DUF4190 domain-containing protein [Candidatus Sulfotelmatobacter sp.]